MLKKLCILLALPLVAVAADDSSQELEPGLYQITVGISGEDLLPGMVEETAEECVTKEDLAADPSSVLGENASLEGCKITQHTWANGKIGMNMECVVEGTRATGESHGTYDANGYEMITTTKIKIEDTTIEMESFIRGKRIGDC